MFVDRALSLPSSPDKGVGPMKPGQRYVKGTLAYRSVKSAGALDGKRIHIGDMVSLADNPPVRVLGLHHQGYDGTIATTEPAPDPTYPYHRSCRANLLIPTGPTAAQRSTPLPLREKQA